MSGSSVFSGALELLIRLDDGLQLETLAGSSQSYKLGIQQLCMFRISFQDTAFSLVVSDYILYSFRGFCYFISIKFLSNETKKTEFHENFILFSDNIQ